MKILINGKLVDFSDYEPDTEGEKKKEPTDKKENNNKNVHDQGKEFLDKANRFNKPGKKNNENP